MVSAATKMDPATEELLKDKGRWVLKRWIWMRRAGGSKQW